MLKHIIGRLFAVIGITTLVVGLMGFQPASADTDSGSTGFEFEVVATSHGAATANTSLSNTQQALVNGATQLLWWYPNHHIKVSKKAVAKAPHIKVKYRKCSVQSRSIAKQAHGASIVVAMPGSKICNTGKLGRIVGGFKWTVRVPAVLKWNKKLRLYQHVYDIKGSTRNPKRMTLIKTCGNRMGGKVDRMYSKVKQVRYASDLVIESNAESVAKAAVTFDFKVTCPTTGATFNVQGSAWAYGKATDRISYTQHTRATVIGSLEYKAKQNISINQSTEADAQASVKISGSCGTTPPVEEDNPPTMECTVPEHIFVGDDAMWADFDITDPDGDPVSFGEVVLTGPIVKRTQQTTDITGGKRLSVKFAASDIPAGTQQDATIKVTGSAGGKSVSCSGTTTVTNSNTGWE